MCVCVCSVCVCVCVLKMANKAPTAGIEHSLAVQASVLTITPPKLPDVTNIPTPTCLRRQRRLLQHHTLIKSAYIELGGSEFIEPNKSINHHPSVPSHPVT